MSNKNIPQNVIAAASADSIILIRFRARRADGSTSTYHQVMTNGSGGPSEHWADEAWRHHKASGLFATEHLLLMERFDVQLPAPSRFHDFVGPLVPADDTDFDPPGDDLSPGRGVSGLLDDIAHPEKFAETLASLMDGPDMDEADEEARREWHREQEESDEDIQNYRGSM